jgi:hypothetical protein
VIDIMIIVHKLVVKYILQVKLKRSNGRTRWLPDTCTAIGRRLADGHVRADQLVARVPPVAFYNWILLPPIDKSDDDEDENENEMPTNLWQASRPFVCVRLHCPIDSANEARVRPFERAAPAQLASWWARRQGAADALTQTTVGSLAADQPRTGHFLFAADS